MTNKESAKLTEPGAFDDPPALVASKFLAFLVRPVLLLLRYGTMWSMPRFWSRRRNGSES